MVFLVATACSTNTPPCNYNEQDDATNDTTPEMTGVTVTNGQQYVCGSFQGGHEDPLLGVIDTDTYQIDVETGSDTPLLVGVSSDDDVPPTVSIQFLTTGDNPTVMAVGSWNSTITDHGAFLAFLPNGVYDMQVIFDNTGVISGGSAAAFDYRVRLAPMPACTPPSAPTYTEMSDATNGVVSVDFANDPSFAAISGDSPESTGITVKARSAYQIAGSASTSAPASVTDEYLDRDTFALTADGGANEFTVQLDWDGSASDLDFIVFEPQTFVPVFAGNTTSTTAGELAQFAVDAGKQYLLWVGAYEGSTATNYRATVCGHSVDF